MSEPMQSDTEDLLTMLRDSARDFCGSPAARARGDAATESAFWRETAALGWLGVAIPEARGGSGGGLAGAGVIAFELGVAGRGRGFADTVAMGAALARHVGAGADALLARLADGTLEVVLDRPRPDGDDDPEVLVAAGGARELRVARWSQADGVTLAAPASGAALESIRTTARSIDRVVARDALRVTDVLARGDAAVALWHDALAARDCLLAAQLVGAARAAMRTGIEYAGVRSQFGQLIGSYQAVQHALVDVMAATDAAEMLVLRALGRLDAGTPDRASLAASAVSFARETGWSGLMKSYDVMGGVGFMEEHPLSALTRATVPLLARLGSGADCDDAAAESVRPGHWLVDIDRSTTA